MTSWPKDSSYLEESGYVGVSTLALQPMETMMKEAVLGKQACEGSLRNILDALYVISGKWKLAVILCLVQSPRRFNEIQQHVTGISAKILAKELKDLELNDFVTRTVYPTTPVSIIYEATGYSKTLRSVIAELSAWGELHREKIRAGMRQSATDIRK